MSHLIAGCGLTVTANTTNNFQNHLVLIIGHRKCHRGVVWVCAHGVGGCFGALVKMSHLIESLRQAG